MREKLLEVTQVCHEIFWGHTRSVLESWPVVLGHAACSPWWRLSSPHPQTSGQEECCSWRQPWDECGVQASGSGLAVGQLVLYRERVGGSEHQDFVSIRPQGLVCNVPPVSPRSPGPPAIAVGLGVLGLGPGWLARKEWNWAGGGQPDVPPGFHCWLSGEGPV